MLPLQTLYLRPKDCYADTTAWKVSKPFLTHLGRSEEVVDYPVVYQGNQKACVPCCFEYLGYVYENPIKWQDFAALCGTDEDGTDPHVALEAARKARIIPGYFYLSVLSPEAIFNALNVSALFVGVPFLPNVGEPHAVVITDVVYNKSIEEWQWECKSWKRNNKQETLYLAIDYPMDFVVCPTALTDDFKQTQRAGLYETITYALKKWIQDACIPAQFESAAFQEGIAKRCSTKSGIDSEQG